MLSNFRCYQLAKELFHETEKLSVKGEIKSQLHRAALSVVLNLAEGSGKFEKKEQRRFFKIAFASIREVQSIFDLLNSKDLAKKSDQLAAATWCLIRSQTTDN